MPESSALTRISKRGIRNGREHGQEVDIDTAAWLFRCLPAFPKQNAAVANVYSRHLPLGLLKCWLPVLPG